MAQIFLDTYYRRLPVSRRDLLTSALDLIALEPQHERGGLYLSAVLDRNVRPLLNRADYNRGGAAASPTNAAGGDREKP